MEEDPAKVYEESAEKEEEARMEGLEPFIITEGFAESEGMYGIMPLSQFIRLQTAACIVIGLVTILFWANLYPKGDWLTPSFFTAFFAIMASYTFYKVWDAAIRSHLPQDRR